MFKYAYFINICRQWRPIFRTLAEMKVEVEINCFVIEPTNQRYHANLFFYSWIRTDLDPSRREFTEQTHGTVDVRQKSVTEYIPEHLSFKFRSIEKCYFADAFLSFLLSFPTDSAAFLSDWSHQDEVPERLSPRFASPYFFILHSFSALYLSYFILRVKLSAWDSVVIINFFLSLRIFFWIAQLWRITSL